MLLFALTLFLSYTIVYSADHALSGRIKLDLNNILDATLVKGKILFLTKEGIIELTGKKARELYWKVKLRNRRKAFGL